MFFQSRKGDQNHKHLKIKSHLNFRPPIKKKRGKKEKYFVRSCFDVFFDVLRWGNRRQLAKLERIGRRFHIVIDNKLGVTPFLRINLEWY